LDLRLHVFLVGGVVPLGMEGVEDDGDLHPSTPSPPRGRNAECGVRNVRASVVRRSTFHFNSAFRTPHSAFMCLPSPYPSPPSSVRSRLPAPPPPPPSAPHNRRSEEPR